MSYHKKFRNSLPLRSCQFAARFLMTQLDCLIVQAIVSQQNIMTWRALCRLNNAALLIADGLQCICESCGMTIAADANVLSVGW